MKQELKYAWGPWIEHDGKSAPVGVYCQATTFDGQNFEGMVQQTAINPTFLSESRWIYDEPAFGRIKTYRERRLIISSLIEEGQLCELSL